MGHEIRSSTMVWKRMGGGRCDVSYLTTHHGGTIFRDFFFWKSISAERYPGREREHGFFALEKSREVWGQRAGKRVSAGQGIGQARLVHE